MTVMKKEYIKPTMMVIRLHHHTMLMAGSPVRMFESNLKDDEEFEIEDELAGEGFWGR